MEKILNGIFYEAEKEQRQAEIADAVAASKLPKYPVPTGSGDVELPMVEIAPSFLLYRPDNGRVVSELLEAAADRNSSIEDIRKDAAALDVQKLLHDLLVEKARHPDGPIFDELAKQARQTEPLLIASDGLVVNGNRRLAAMRALLAEDPARYDAFGSVRAAVLDADTQPEALEYIEAALQMAPDLKLAYGWVNRRLKLREHVRDLSRERIVEVYRLADENQIDGELDELAIAEDYLSWLRSARAYHVVADLEVAFRELLRQLHSVEQQHLKPVWKTIGFSMIRARTEIDGNFTHYFPFSPPAPPALKAWVPRMLAEDQGLIERQGAGENRGIDAKVASRLMAWLSNPGNATAVAGATMALADTLKADQQKHLGPARIQSSLRAARRQLETLPAGTITEEQFRTIRAEAAALLAYLDNRDKAEPESGVPAPHSPLGTLLKRFR